MTEKPGNKVLLKKTHPARTASGAATVGCGVRVAALLTPSDMPGSVELFRFTNAPLPGSHGIGQPAWDIRQYVCGEEESFISDVIMYGRYRTLENAFVRSLGYKVGKWPLLPYEGPAVSDLPHDVFETYEEIYQFQSAKAASIWLADERATPDPDDLSGLPLPAGFIARSEAMGPDDSRDEHTIGIGGQDGDTLIFVSFRGGMDLSWADVKNTWLRAYSSIDETLSP
jgi:hypothetical protein